MTGSTWPDTNGPRVSAARVDDELEGLQARVLRVLFRWCLLILTPLCVVFIVASAARPSASAVTLAASFTTFQISVMYTWRMLGRRGPRAAQRVFLLAASAVVAVYLLFAPLALMLVGMMGIFYFIRVTTAFDPGRTVSYGLGWLLMYAATIALRWGLDLPPIDLGAMEIYVVVGLPVAVMVLFARVDAHVSRTMDRLLERSQRHRGELIGANEVLNRQRTELTVLAGRQERANADLERANEELRSISYALSHDLRAPLVNARGLAAELRRGLTAARSLEAPPTRGASGAIDAEVTASLHFLDASLERMDTLIAGILRLSRIGRREFVAGPVDVNVVVDGVLAGLRHTMRERQVTVDVGPLPTVDTDELAITQILSNLLANAVAYLDPSRPGHISVRATREGDHFRFAIGDNGRGIPTGLEHAVFEPFRRLPPMNEEGEGLGLTYVQALVQRLGGRVWCESVAGVGSTFHFTIPGTGAA